MNVNHKKLFIALIFILISIFIFRNNVYAIIEKPSQRFPNQAKKNYGWMIESNKSNLSIAALPIMSKFITKNEMRRYIKLKMRNFIKDYLPGENFEPFTS